MGSGLSDWVPRAERLNWRELVAKTVGMIGLTLLIAKPCVCEKLTADQILAKAAETSRNLNSFRALLFPWWSASSNKWQSGLETEVAEFRPGRIRVSNKAFLLVSDGEMTWTYIPDLREYSAVKAAPLLEEHWRFCPYADSGCPSLDYAWILAHPVPRAYGGARLRGEQGLTAGGRQVDCYVITIPVSYRVGPLAPAAASEKLWVDKARYTVWHDEFYEGWEGGSFHGGAADTNLGATAYTLEELVPAPLPEETFRFDPPAGAKQVESIRPDYDVEPWVHVYTFDPPEASLDRDTIGFRAPDFALRDLSGKDFRLQDLRGKTVVLDFWANWCMPCKRELDAVQKLHGELVSKGVVFLGVDDESPGRVEGFVKAHGYTFPMLLDTGQKVHQLYGVHYAPTTVVINRKGKIAAHYVGAGGEAQLRRALKSAGLNTTP